MWKNNSVIRAIREAKDLPLEQYDIIINDFEFITARACKVKNLPSVQFGHQASFYSQNTPRPEKKSTFGELILQKYAKASSYIGLHFQPYDSFIYPPVIKDVFLQGNPKDDGHITIYLPACNRECLEDHFRAFPHTHFHWFLKGTKEVFREGNITFFPVDNELFNVSLMNCHGIITGGGFETPAEALYLGKKLMCIPIRGQYEQQCNAAALRQMGVKVLDDIDGYFATEISLWLNALPKEIKQEANQVSDTLQYLMDNYPGTINENGITPAADYLLS
jgi:uncharacterized protein (TIGR00661 family)